MKRVGFLISPDDGWIGGVNYFKNLLYALKSYPSNDLQFVVYIGTKTPSKYKRIFQDLCVIKELPVLDRGSLSWFFWRVSKKILRSDYLLSYFLRNENLDVLSHSSVWGIKNVRCINWIPDFQHIHLPSMFSSKEIASRNKEYKTLARKSYCVILSSQDATNDFRDFVPSEKFKARTLQFVAQPSNVLFLLAEVDLLNIKKKYNLPDKFFFLPNQFWKHKNHIVVFQALNELRVNGTNICVVCSGAMTDYRNQDHVEFVKTYIKQNDLDVRLLGIIPYDDVLLLMKASIAVINPSLFEGWSSTVEECKAIGKSVILSNIGVHREQNPPNASFFDPSDYHSLALIIHDFWCGKNIFPESNRETVIDDLKWRTQKFAQEFQIICRGYPLYDEAQLDLNLIKNKGGYRNKGGIRAIPLFSIVIATFNSAATLESTLLSIFNQKSNSFEVIVIDGGSSDGTVEILKKYDDLISCWISEEDQGISDAFNKGIKLALGEYINFQGDGDGFYSENSLMDIESEIKEKPALICGRIRRISNEGDVLYISPYIKKFNKKSLLFRMSLPHQGLFTHISIFKKFGLFDIYNIYSMDYDYLLRLYHDFPEVHTSDVVVANWRADGLGEGKEIEIFKEYNCIKIKNNVAHPLTLFLIDKWIHFKYFLKKIILRIK